MEKVTRPRYAGPITVAGIYRGDGGLHSLRDFRPHQRGQVGSTGGR